MIRRYPAIYRGNQSQISTINLVPLLAFHSICNHNKTETYNKQILQQRHFHHLPQISSKQHKNRLRKQQKLVAMKKIQDILMKTCTLENDHRTSGYTSDYAFDQKYQPLLPQFLLVHVYQLSRRISRLSWL